MNRTINVPLSTLMKQITMHVRLSGARTFGVRVRIAVGLIRFAAFILGVGFNVDLAYEPWKFWNRDVERGDGTP